MNLNAMLSASSVDAHQLGRELDALTHHERVRAVRQLARRHFARLFEVSGQVKKLTFDDFVPSDLPPNTVVRHHGINSMPLFRVFEKPMYRTSEGAICGRNAQFWSFVTGPGYFTVTPHRYQGVDGIAFDYKALPTTTPEGWPRVVSNRQGLSFFVYRDMCDVMRAVSDHVTIGKAFRNEHDLGQYFILVRQDPDRELAGSTSRVLPPTTRREHAS